jgi:drug/metabolite transporter (DMT)-like permease
MVTMITACCRPFELRKKEVVLVSADLSPWSRSVKPSTIIGILLIVLGVVGLAMGGFSFTRKEKVVDLGPIEATADKKESVAIPPVLGALALIGGVVLVVAGSRRT